MTPVRATGAYEWYALLRLIQTEFSFMDGRIDPPTSMHRLTEAAIAEQARTGEVWFIEDADAPVACVFLNRTENGLHLSKLAVAAEYRGRGLARHLIETALLRARLLKMHKIWLQVRVELIENQDMFRALGFSETERRSHEGYMRATTVVMERDVKR